MRNKLMRSLAGLLSAFLLLVNIDVQALAAFANIVITSDTEYTVKHESFTGISYDFSEASIGGKLFATAVPKLSINNAYYKSTGVEIPNASGLPVYCLDTTLPVGTGNIAYTDRTLEDFSPMTDTAEFPYKKLNYAIMYGYTGSTKYGCNKIEEQYATQLVIWCLVHDWYNNSSESIALTEFTEDINESLAGATKSNIKKAYYSIKNNIEKHELLPSFDGDSRYWAYDPSETSDYKYKCTFTDTNGLGETELAKFNFGSQIAAASRGQVTVVISANTVTFMAKSIPDTDYTIEFQKLGLGNQFTKDINAIALFSQIVDGKFKDQPMIFYTTDGAQDPPDITLSLLSDNGIQIIKKWTSPTDDTATLEANYVTFVIGSSTGQSTVQATQTGDGEYVFSAFGMPPTYFKLGADGTFFLSGLPDGSYTATETFQSATLGDRYGVTEKTQTIVVTNGTGTITFENYRKTGDGEIIKTWDSGKTLTANEIAILESEISFTVQYSDGRYVIATQNTAPDIYGNELFDGTYDYTGLTSNADEASKFTMKDSKLLINGLPTGTYTVTELSTLINYPKTQSATLTIEEGQTGSVSFKNIANTELNIEKHFEDESALSADVLKAEFGKVSVKIKVDSSMWLTADKLENGVYNEAYFTTIEADAEVFTLDENGKLRVILGEILSNTDGRTYTVIESYSGSDYYTDSEKEITVGTNLNGALSVPTIVLNNALKPGGIEFDKSFLDENGSVITIPDTDLSKVEFTVKNENGEYLTFDGNNGAYEYSGTSTTPTKLKLSSTYRINIDELPSKQTYTVSEVSGVTGYNYNVSKAFEVMPAQVTSDIFVNEAQTGTLIVQKQSADGKLDGWKFLVELVESPFTGYTYSKTFTTGSDGKITVPNLRVGTYKVTEVATGIVGYFTPEAQNAVIRYGETTTVEMENVPYGSVQVTKVDKDYPDNKLTGAEFTVYASDKTTVVGKLTEVSTGVYQLDKLPYNSYFLKETKAPTNYVLDNNFYAFSITTAGAVVTVETEAGKNFINNPQTGELVIQKQSADGKLDGWKFTVELVESPFTGYTYSKTFTTGSDGKITVSDLRVGTYKITEVTTGIVGYFTPEAQNAVIRYGETTTVEMENIPYGSVQVTKVDKDYPDNKLTGAEFTVYASDKITVVGKLTEVSTGVYQLDKLPYNSYFLKETKAPTNYVLDNNFYAFSITRAGSVVTVETEAGKNFINNPQTGELVIQKQSADGKLDGWKFTVELVESPFTGYTYSKTFTTGSDGKITVSDLRIGTYKVTEVTTGIVGYFTPEAQNAVIRYGETTTVEMENIPYGSIVLNKVNCIDTSKALPGATYAVYVDVNRNGTYEADVDTFYGKLDDSDGDGTYRLDEVPYGFYLVKETDAPEGYLVDEAYYSVNIDGAAVEKAVTNDDSNTYFLEVIIRGNIHITKVDADYTHIKLEGAEFTVFAEDKTTVVGILTEIEPGEYELTGIPYGNYFIQETKAPEYFVRDENFYPFSITENGVTVTVGNVEEENAFTFRNKPQTGKLKVVKTAYDGKIEGISFDITVIPLVGEKETITRVTDANGEINLDNIRVGKVIVHEVLNSATYSYTLPADETLVIARDELAQADMYNAPPPDIPQTAVALGITAPLSALTLALLAYKRKKKQK